MRYFERELEGVKQPQPDPLLWGDWCRAQALLQFTHAPHLRAHLEGCGGAAGPPAAAPARPNLLPQHVQLLGQAELLAPWWNEHILLVTSLLKLEADMGCSSSLRDSSSGIQVVVCSCSPLLHIHLSFSTVWPPDFKLSHQTYRQQLQVDWLTSTKMYPRDYSLFVLEIT